ncbi:MAG: peptidoglycan-binding protein [Alphaproteobacteria bacterium]
MRRFLPIAGLLLLLPAIAEAQAVVDPIQAFRCERAYGDRDFAAADEICRPLADAGLADAQFVLGMMRRNGDGLARDYARAAIWFVRAAEQGHAEARFNLGAMYHYGVGLPQNRVEAWAWYDLAVAAGHAEAAVARDFVAQRMGATELAQAQARARVLGGGTAATAATPEPSPTLIAGVQKRLAALGFTPGPADGVMGAKTRSAIRTFQQRQGLAVDGEPSEALRAALDRALEARVAPPAPETQTAAQAPVESAPVEPSAGEEDRTQELVDDLRETIREVERERSAQPRVLERLRGLVRRYDRPWRVVLLEEDFHDGDFTADPAWRVVSGQFFMRWSGLRTAFSPPVVVSPFSGGNEATQLFGAILGEIARDKSNKRQVARVAEIRTGLRVSNAFAATVRLRLNAVSDDGGFAFGTYRDSRQTSAYRLAYVPGRQPALELLRVAPGGTALLARRALTAPLDDGIDHALELRRDREGGMTVLLDGNLAIETSDRASGDAFDGVVIVNRGGTYTIRSVTVLGSGT